MIRLPGGTRTAAGETTFTRCAHHHHDDDDDDDDDQHQQNGVDDVLTSDGAPMISNYWPETNTTQQKARTPPLLAVYSSSGQFAHFGGSSGELEKGERAAWGFLESRRATFTELNGSRRVQRDRRAFLKFVRNLWERSS
ncbi:hypothetical protein K0M31_017515 [Melipona bicolor]|uniref:Uncharacterized protein n=1 Tax=Melipona bicolor TaxID=60889 RepID=A0AA40G505_9HYME|nr:hypothetical protein K0M31_017515 [Melipona bicolor]